MRRALVVSVLAGMLFLAMPVLAQEGNQFSLSVSPQLFIPLGADQPFTFGGGATLTAGFRFPAIPSLSMGAQFGFMLLSPGLDPASSSISSASLISLGPVANFIVTPPGPFGVALEAQIAYGLIPYQGLLGSIASGSLTAEASFRFGSAVSVGVTGGYSYQFSLGDQRTFAHGPVAGIGVRYYLGGASQSRLKVVKETFEPVFPVFHAYYDAHPFGSVRLQNTESGIIKDVKVSIFVPGYMNQPKVARTIDQLAPSEQVEVPIVALFNPSILAITGNTKIAAELHLEYKYLDASKTDTAGVTLDMYHRNAMTWDDDRKAAAFITPTDPGILMFSKAVVGELRSGTSPAINTVFRQAIGLFEALRARGVRYVTDPTTPYAQTSQNKFAVDYLQFPSQTLGFGAGDCDDLSILYAALLESVGIESAFVTVPGHIYVAVCLALSEAQARGTFTNSTDLIFAGGQAWMPVEITAVEKGFNAAWRVGAREWRENAESGKAALIKVREAWEKYASVEFSDAAATVERPDLKTTMQGYAGELARFIDDQIGEPAAALRERIKSSDDPARYRNQLGVLYAQYGRYDEALVEFRAATAAGYLPGRVNLGNLQMLTKQYSLAAETYKAVLEAKPDNVGALVGFAKANRELENFGLVRSTFEKLRTTAPDVAVQFAYLIGERVSEEMAASRASLAVQQETFIWPAE
jgi:tetratricopeptide (TPR) repeat protein